MEFKFHSLFLPGFVGVGRTALGSPCDSTGFREELALVHGHSVIEQDADGL